MVTSFSEKRKEQKHTLKRALVEMTQSYFLTDVLVWQNHVYYHELFIPFLGIYPKEVKSVPQSDIFVPCNIIHNGQDMEIT